MSERAFLPRVRQIQPGEGRAVVWSFCYFFFLLAAYYVLRPLRDEMGVAGGVRNLPWLFTATFVVMLVAVPIYGAVVARLPRRRFVPLVYHFFVFNLALFWVLLQLGIEPQAIARVFFVWISVFNLFVVSVFWSFMSDLFRSDQGKRLFGLIAAGGSLGALAGPTLTVWLAKPLGPVNLLIVAVVLLELAVVCASRLERVAGTFTQRTDNAPAPNTRMGGNPFAGIMLVLRSRYLGGIALWVALLSLAGTVLYLMQAEIVAAASVDPAERTRIFASIDLAAGLLTLAIQFVATGRFMTRFGVAVALAFLPVVFGLGFALLAITPALLIVIGFQAVQRTANFAVSNPAREVLFTVAAREEKYKAKNVIDIVVFRGADAVSSWLPGMLGLAASALAFAMVPVAVIWALLALWLGHAHRRRETSPPSRRL
ncbi:MAG TPA: MFS transporter [Burkholderiales bacterium]|nr:MFS transporter [Burkholderiales bacterium]